MIRAGLMALVLAGPAAAEGLVGQALCAAVWDKADTEMGGLGVVTDASVRQEGDWCVVDAPVLDVQGDYRVDWHMDRLRFRGSALGWFAGGSTLPEGLELVVEGLRVVVQTGNPQMDWLIAAQARPNGIDAEAVLGWDPVAKVLRLERVSLDFPGDNMLRASAVLTGVDLSSMGAMQMSATGFALTDVDLAITTHGLFEWYVLMVLGSVVLPPDGDMDAAMETFRADLSETMGDLPETSVSAESKAALDVLIAELPNPAGDLTLSLRADPGLGPVRFAGYAMTGVPETLSEAAPLFQGVTLDIGWTHGDAD
ncbi:MAG: hypothetical protein HC844_17345 [Tabrizicola sp.]|nr:hypothetical protein [Tabrizicola sp.]